MNGLEIQIKDLNLVLSGNEILENINLTVKAGEIHCLVGPNGGGKTSLLRCILGQMPFTGSIEMKYEKDRVIGYVPQVLDFERSLTITVEDFMAMTNQTRPCFLCISKKHKETVDNLLKKLGVYEKKKRLLGNLSGGERQRVLFAKILTQESQVILLDEPTASLDMRHEEDLLKEVSKERAKDKIVILVIHNLRTAIKYCSRLILLSNGNIVKDGSVEEVITEENLNNVFGIKTKVYYNEISKSLDFCII